MKIVRLKTNIPVMPALVCLALGIVLPAYGKVAEGVEALANPYGKVEEGVDTLVNFKGPNGAQPMSILEDASGNFFGTTRNGGKYNQGIVFEILQNGKQVTLIDFNGKNGAAPEAGLLLGTDGSLYGTTKSGGANNKGTVFKIGPDGKFSTLVNFNGKN